MSGMPEPFTVSSRSDSQTYQLTLNLTSGLPAQVCTEWRRRSFLNFPDEIAMYRHPENKKMAKAGAYALIQYLKLKQEEERNIQHISVGDFAKDMFTEGAAHLKRWKEKGYVLKPQTIDQHRRYLVNYLIPEFGEIPLDKIRPINIEDFLLLQEIGNSSRNGILYTLKLVMKEAKREGIIEMIPEFESFKRNSRRQDVLSNEELEALFPDDEKELTSIWKRPDDMRKERDEIALMFGTMFCLMVSTGMRSGESRALSEEQAILSHSGLIIDRAVDSRGLIGMLKMETEEDVRSRAVLIPEKTIKTIEPWLDRKPKCPDYPGLVFPYRDKVLNGWYILDRFQFGLNRLGIDHEKRRLTVHCLRYTYNTRMKTKLPRDILKEFLGHRSDKMPEHYDNPILIERLMDLQDMRPRVESFWTGVDEKPEDKKVPVFEVS